MPQFRPAVLAIAGAALACAANVNIPVNFSGLSAFDDKTVLSGIFYIPPDQGSAVGPGYYVQMVNQAYAVYDTTGHLTVGPQSLNTFFSNAGVSTFGNTYSDPRIVYDPSSGRWIAAAITTGSNSNSVVLAVSQTSNPTGTWKATSFVGNTTANNFADYPTIAVDSGAFYIATNNFANGATFDGVSLTTIPKTDLLNAGGPVVSNRSHFENIVGGSSSGTQPFTFAPVSDFGSRSQGVILATDGFTPAAVIHSYLVSNGSTNSATLSSDSAIAVPSYWNNQAAHQPDATRNLDAVDFRVGQNNVYQVGDYIWIAQSILTSAATGGSAFDAIRWYEIQQSTNTLLQSGTISLAHHDFIDPAIAANANGDVVIGFTGSGDSTTTDYPGLWYVTGTTSGGITTFGTATMLKNGSGNYYISGGGENRWGDYSAVSVDPNHSYAFWIAGEVAINGSGAGYPNVWGTQIAELDIVPEPSAGLLVALGLAGQLMVSRRRARKGA
ncbi:MAG: PEP-CTERM sorting domain-containing protein [Planctomycetia bacterium]|nr:PEP-CTERM sorting domain-containing protein [Planctomycetia bacterium]